MGFVVEPHAPARLELGGLLPRAPPQRPLVGLNVSGLLLAGNAFGLRVDYATLVEQLVERLIESAGSTCCSCRTSSAATPSATSPRPPRCTTGCARVAARTCSACIATTSTRSST